MTTITLYRADASDLYDGVGSCWAESESDAKAYTDNQGFGGPVVHAVNHEINEDRVLDLTGEQAVAELAKLLDLDKQDLLDMGGRVYHCWENSARIPVRDLIAANYDWVKYTDDFPVNCITWRRMA